MIALVLVLVAVAAFVAVTGLAALDHARLRADLIEGLPEDVDDYSDEQIDRAVWVLVGGAAGLGALLSLAQVLSIRTAALRRSLPSRTTFVIITVLYLPVGVLSWAIRNAGLTDTVLSAVNLLGLLAATILITRQPVSAWLRQTERTGRAPLVPPAPGDELTPAAAGRRPLHDRGSDDQDPERDGADRELEAGGGPLPLEPGRDDGDDVTRQ